MVDFRVLLVDYSNENIHENKESHQLEAHPENVGQDCCFGNRVMHDGVPALTCCGADQNKYCHVKGVEVAVGIDPPAIRSLHGPSLNLPKQIHACYGEDKDQ